jgi:5-(carboxyamino)imidazole ribonucleotide synthase
MTVGILGGGQLGRMLALAGYPLGIRTELYDPVPEACAEAVASRVRAPYDDWHTLARFAEGKVCITYEFENVPTETANWLVERVPVRPTPRALQIFSDRLLEKQFLNSLGIPMPAFASIDPEKPEEALEVTGLPCVVKTRRFGYDGKGQGVAHTPKAFRTLVNQFQPHPLIAEAYVPFEREVSVIGVRSLHGEIAVYPLVENRHREGILHVSLVGSDSPVEAEYITRLLNALDYVGVMALEMFQVGGRLLANEVAPRVHNSGHWTIEGAETSQFENHLRAILGLPLGSTAMRGYCAMVNLVGDLPPIEAVLRLPNVHLHLYGKTPSPRRKLGHLTIRTDTREERDELLKAVLELVPFV